MSFEGLCTDAGNCNYASGFNLPAGVALNPSSGVLYVTNPGAQTLCRVPAGGGASSCVFGVAGQTCLRFVVLTCTMPAERLSCGCSYQDVDVLARMRCEGADMVRSKYDSIAAAIFVFLLSRCSTSFFNTCSVRLNV
jgi:hypothetical protein